MAKFVSSDDGSMTGSPISRTKSRESHAQPSPQKVQAKPPHTVSRKSSVADLLSRLTASTAASRSKKRDKGEPLSPGVQYGDTPVVGGSRSVSLPTPNSAGSSHSFFHRLTFGGTIDTPSKKPVISRPIPTPSPTSDGLKVAKIRSSNRSPSKGLQTPSSIRAGSPNSPISQTKSWRPKVTPSSPMQPPQFVESSSMSSSRSSSFDKPRPAPQRPRNVSGRSSALGRPNNLAIARSSSRLRKASGGNAGPKSSNAKASKSGVENGTELHAGCNDRIQALETQLQQERAKRLELEAQQRPTSEVSPRTSVVDHTSLKKELEILKNELSASNLEKQRAVERLRQSLSELNDAFEDADTLRVARNNLEWQVKGLQVSHRTLEQQLKISQRDTRKCRRSLSSLETKVKEMQIQLEEKKLENDELSQTIERIMNAAQHYWRNVPDTANHPSPVLTESPPGSPPHDPVHPDLSPDIIERQKGSESKQFET